MAQKWGLQPLRDAFGVITGMVRRLFPAKKYKGVI